MPIAGTRLLEFPVPEKKKTFKVNDFHLTLWGGDISRFTNPKQIQKLAGLAVVENSSGKRKGLSGISRRGRKRLRWVLFQLARSMVKSNKEMKAYHQYYITRKDNPLKKMQSLMAIAGKITRIFFGILKNGTEYDPEIVMKDLNKAAAA